MKYRIFLLILLSAALTVQSQTFMTDAERNAKKDSTLRAVIHADSLRIEAQFAKQEKFDHLISKAVYPRFKGPGAEFAGVLPVKTVTEIPDPNLEYKLLFEVVENNPDSLLNTVSASLVEVARIINLHIASKIPENKIKPVIVVHGPVLDVLTKSEFYKEKHHTDNPNLELLKKLEELGAKFIACGQAMQFFDVPAEHLLPEIKISLTAQTVLSSYQLKGYVLYKVEPF